MKERISITIDKDLLDWVDRKIAGKLFANRSHALEFLAMQMMDEEEGFAPYHQNTAKDDGARGHQDHE
jgi:metal-responsive CopG/Arc/MetJ family transcriptional regulator